MPQPTILVFADQLHRSIGALRTADPATDTVLLVESEQKITGRPWHRQRLHLVLTALRRFAIELESEGFTVDHRLQRHRERLLRNPRVAREVRAFDRLADAARIPERASEMRAALAAGRC